MWGWLLSRSSNSLSQGSEARLTTILSKSGYMFTSTIRASLHFIAAETNLNLISGLNYAVIVAILLLLMEELDSI
ncbi:hypothetical protein NBRC116583_00890 [Arenicella sp. 4NH20-0111]